MMRKRLVLRAYLSLVNVILINNIIIVPVPSVIFIDTNVATFISIFTFGQ